MGIAAFVVSTGEAGVGSTMFSKVLGLAVVGRVIEGVVGGVSAVVASLVVVVRSVDCFAWACGGFVGEVSACVVLVGVTGGVAGRVVFWFVWSLGLVIAILWASSGP